MELRADDIVARDHRGDRAAVIGGRRRRRRDRPDRAGTNGRNRRAGPPSPVAMPSSSGCGAAHVSVFQPMCGNLQRRVGRPDRRDVAGNPVEPGDDLVFEAARRHQLHADANAEERPRRAGARARSSASTMPGTASSPRRQSAKAPTPGSTMWSARAHAFGIGASPRLRARAPPRARRARTPCGRNADCPSRNRRWRRSSQPPASGNRPMTSGGGRRRGREGAAGGAAARGRARDRSRARRSAVAARMTMSTSGRPPRVSARRWPAPGPRAPR